MPCIEKTPPEHRWTQYCPHCGYNLRGLRDSRCPECGRTFDRSQLPLVDQFAPRAPHPLANVPLVAAILLAMVDYSWGATWTNTVAQFGKAVVVYALVGLWIRLRLADLADADRRHFLLWALLPAWSVASIHSTVAAYTWPILASLALLATVLLVSYCVISSPQTGLRATGLILVMVFLIVPGGVFALLSTIKVLTGTSGGEYEIAAWRFPSTPKTDATVAVAGALALAVGILLAAVLKRKR